MKFYKRDPDRALAGMAPLNPAQRGIYNSIIDLLYSCDGLVPCRTAADDAAIARQIAVDPRTWRTFKTQLMAAGKVRITTDGRLTANGVEEGLFEAQSRSETARKRVSYRWEKYKLANTINAGAIRHRNTSKSKSKNSSTNVEAQCDVDGGKGVAEESDDNFGVVKPNPANQEPSKPGIPVSDELKAIIQRKQQFDKDWR